MRNTEVDVHALCPGNVTVVLGREMLPLVFELTSTAWLPGAVIPPRHTCSAADVSPPLSWTAPPTGAASLALVMDDPDAPGRTWSHWLVWNLPAATRSLAEGQRPGAPGMVAGTNDFGKVGYGGPCPPPGHGTHRYFTRLYALDTLLSLGDGAGLIELKGAMKGHVLASTELMGRSWR